MRVVFSLLLASTALVQVLPAQAQADPPDLAFIQQRLFDHGYDPGNEDGVMDEGTREAIRQAQRNVGQEPTGIPNDLLLFAIRFKVDGRVWGAAAASNDGKYAVAVAHATRRGARDEVMNECKRQSAYPDTCKWLSLSQDDAEIGWRLTTYHCYNEAIGQTGDVVKANIPPKETSKFILQQVAQHKLTAADCKILSISTSTSMAGGGSLAP